MTQTTEPDPVPEGVPKPGDVLAGKYRVERVLGRGGMGFVVAAEHTTLRQKVAVKMLLPDAAKRGDATERFLREGRAAVAIKGEHVARVMDVGTLDSGEAFLVMELLVGADLNAVIRDRGPLPPAEAVDYILQAAEAIAEAHALGIIHRDLKPANLFLTQRPDGSPLVKVLDFGLSKVTRPDAFEASLTAANVVMGSPYYMSPEQIRSLKGLDQRSDIYSLGVILYQLLAGVRPFDAEALAELFLKIGVEPPPPIREKRADVSPELEAAVFWCMEKVPAERPQTVAEMARRLAPFGSESSRASSEAIHRMLGDDAGRAGPSRPPPATTSTEVAVDDSATVPLLASAADAGPAVVRVNEPPTIDLSVKSASGSMTAVSANVEPASEGPKTVSRGRSGSKAGTWVAVAVVLAVGAIGVATMAMRGGGPPPRTAVQPPAPAPTTSADAGATAAPR